MGYGKTVKPLTVQEASENENTGTLASVTGARSSELPFKSEHYRNRAEAATALCHAIAECDPVDACTIMEAAYDDLRTGPPLPSLIGVAAEADWWATWATPIERKCLALASYLHLSPSDRVRFLNHVQGA